MTTWQILLTTWHAHPSVLIGCAALAAGYLVAVRFRPPAVALYYLAGVLLLLLALISPLHVLGERYLFSAHMLQHLLLLQAVPPLLLLGIPAPLVMRAPVARRSPFAGGKQAGAAAFGAAEAVLSRPALAWALGSGAMWAWHVPAFYNATLAHEGVHIAEHLCFLATATIFWYPILGPPARRLAPLGAALYLFAGMAAGSLLGIILTFAPPGLYPAYLHPIDDLGILPLLRVGWGLTPAADQQLGGLLMWVPGNLVYLGALIATLARWYHTPEETPPAPAGVAPAPRMAHQPRRSHGS